MRVCCAGAEHFRKVVLVARSTSLVKVGATPAFVLARVFAADGARVAAFVRLGLPQQRPAAKDRDPSRSRAAT